MHHEHRYPALPLSTTCRSPTTSPIHPRQNHPITSSLIKALLVTAPAKVRLDIRRCNPQRPDPASHRLTTGTAAHAMFIGRGEPIEVIEADSYRTKAAQVAKAKALAEGKTPVLVGVYEKLEPMADVALDSFMDNTDISGVLMSGSREPTIVWREAGITARCRPDAYGIDGLGVPIIVHYKTTAVDVGDERALQRLAVQLRWDIVHAHYAAGVEALTGVEPGQFFAIQEVDPPYLCVVRELDLAFVARGEQDRKRALRIWARCVHGDTWPALPIETDVIECPGWHAPDEWEG